MSHVQLHIVTATPAQNQRKTGMTVMYTLSDGAGPFYKQQLVAHTGVLYPTILDRIKLFGLHSPLVFYPGRIPLHVSRANRLEKLAARAATKKRDRLGAKKQLDGGLVTRSERVIPVNTRLDDELCPTPAAATGPLGKSFFYPDVPAVKKNKSIERVLARVKAFNNEMERRGFLRPGDFNNNAALSL